jgi:protein TonB
LHREIPEIFWLEKETRRKVVLAVVIDATGRLAKAEVIEASNEAFANASLEALKKSTFLPARRNGQPVTSRAILPIRFSLIE